MRTWLVVFAACTIDHRVEILLGPDKDTPSDGFTCKDPQTPVTDRKLLIERAYDVAKQQLHFNLIVDLVDLGNHFPNCLPEDVEAACKDGTCTLSTAVSPQRFCKHVIVDNVVDETQAARQVTDALAADFPVVIAEAPHRPVIVRAVITNDTYDCGPLEVASGGAYPNIDGTEALGCAYSCPVSLDDAQGTISLGLDLSLAGSDAGLCAAAVKICAEFPGGPTP